MRNDWVIAVPYEDDRYNHVDDLPKRVRKELEQFFVTVSEMTKKEVQIDGWAGPKSAHRAIDRIWATMLVASSPRRNSSRGLSAVTMVVASPSSVL